MKFLNVGCGGQRPQSEEWHNLDNLRSQLAIGTPERKNLDKEPRYFDCDLLKEGTPFQDDFFDGVLLQHVIEHFTCHEAVAVLVECRRVLKPGGIMLVTVPDADYFLKVHEQDTKDNAVQLFGEPIHDSWCKSFFDYALFRNDHKQILTKTSLTCLLLKSGFTVVREFSIATAMTDERMLEMFKQLTRRTFSAEIIAVK